MFDNFEPFREVQKQKFLFFAKRYEIWVGGNLIKSGFSDESIKCEVENINDSEKMVVSYHNNSLQSEISEKNEFDWFITGKDRLQLVTIPEITNSENMGIMSFQMVLGSSRKQKNFKSNEPYCCNLFLKDGTIAKISFSFSNPEKLIEFYS